MSSTSSIWTSSVGVGLVLLAALGGAYAQGEGRDRFLTLPLRPAELAAAMPKAPEGWAVKQSTAKNTYMRWLGTRATRVFETVPEGDGSTPITVRVTLTDTGRYPPTTQRFRQVPPMKPPGRGATAVQRRFAGFPAIIHRHGDGRRQVQVLVAGRYIVDLLAPPELERGALKPFLDTLNLEALRGKRGRPVTELPDKYTMRSINQLDPEKNRSYLMSITATAEVEEMLRQTEAAEPSEDVDDDE